MNIRQDIIWYLDYPVERYSQYQLLKESLQYTNHSQADGRNTDSMIDHWFRGVIESLFYRPNHFCLVLKANQNIGKTTFFRTLIPNTMASLLTESFNGGKEELYSKLLVVDNELTKLSRKQIVRLASMDEFMVRKPYTKDAYAEKRLCSYAATTNDDVIPARSFVILELESIDQVKMNSIDKKMLWIEIFNKFRP